MTMSLAMTTLEQLDVRLHEHARVVLNLRTALDIQMNRISHMYAEPGVQPHARHRRQSLRVVPIRQSRRPHLRSALKFLSDLRSAAPAINAGLKARATP
jgi:hypothetical protein